MSARALFFIATLFLPALVHADGLTIGQPLSTWRSASGSAKTQLIDVVASQLSTDIGVRKPPLPVEVITQCINDNRSPDQMLIRNQTVHITVGMAAALCIKMHVPQLATGKYRQDT